jgi:histidine ammonia-lyase
VLSHPASADSITTSGNKEDFVSMGMTAANKLQRVVVNTRNVVAIEALAVAQAIDFLTPLKPGKRGQAAHAAIRAVSPPITEDRILSKDFARASDLIASGALAKILR